MEISPIIFLIIYGVFLLFFLIMSIINFYNVIRFGFSRGPIYLITFIYLGAIVLIVLGTLGLLSDINLSQPLEITLPTISFTR